ncbi:hypothetical protein [Roseateles asaccharophilus]|uniref:DUF3618 domain-containing protein n=1 Tax=Roseateles asaccharophilus TaxID=582607 RepID=A0ABU2A414_9BURK|nr:hypothetical protein [Roseateles asaccharophilus]MDR7331775.1 hypothetical protein [Roseateles asaccharophilus]
MPDPLTPDQRAAVDAMLASALTPINERLDRGAEKMGGLTDSLAELRDELKRNTGTTEEVRALLDLGKGGLRVLGVLGAAVKWIGGMATGFLALYALVHALKTGSPPKP